MIDGSHEYFMGIHTPFVKLALLGEKGEIRQGLVEARPALKRDTQS